MTKTKLLFCLFLLFTNFKLLADLRPCYLTVSLSATKTKFTTTELVQINVTLTNGTNESHSIVVPGNQSKGFKLIYFSWYKVDENNFYTEVYRDSRNIVMDTSTKGNANFKRLAAGELITVPFFFNDVKNAKTHINSNYELPKLPPGKYKIIAWYYPWDEELANYAFNKYDWKGQDKNPAKNTELLDLSESGTQSTYFDVELVSDTPQEAAEIFNKECPINCKFCDAIDHNHWKKVERIIRRQSSSRSRFKIKGKNVGNWNKNHRQVAHYGPYPDAILASLPSYTGIELVFQNKKGYHYFYLSWQIGKIKSVSSRLNGLWYGMFNFSSPFKSSKQNYYVLKKMMEW